MGNDFTTPPASPPTSSTSVADDPAIVETPLPEVSLLLYADALEHLADFLGGSSADTAQRLTRRSIINAYNRLYNETDWRYLYKHGRVHMVAPYSTGTIAFNLSTLVVTLTGGTWPLWAKYGRLMIGTIVYAIDQVPSSTTLILKQPECPDQTIASGTTYLLYRNCYPFATDFKRICEPSGEIVRRTFYISPEEFIWLERQRRQQGSVFRYTVMQNPNRNGEYCVFVYGYPTTQPSETLDFLYQRTARPIVRSGYDANDYTGTASIMAGDIAVTGSGTNFTSNMVGSYLRFSSNVTPPDGQGSLNPFTEQRKIRNVNSTTSITLDAAVDNAYSGTAFRISDPLDFPQYMNNAFFRCAEWQYAILSRDATADNYFAAYQREYIRAKECDSVADVRRSLGQNMGWSDFGWRSPLGPAIS